MLAERFQDLQLELTGFSSPREAEEFAMQYVRYLAIAKPRKVGLRG
jgi:hypothetical protein